MKFETKMKSTFLIFVTLIVNLTFGQSTKLEKDTLNSNPNYKKLYLTA